MLSKMKLAILLLLSLQVVSLKLKERKMTLSAENQVVYLTSYVEPVYYNSQPMYYTFYSSPLYYYYLDPTYVYPATTTITYYRKDNQEEKKEKTPEEMKKEVEKLKQEIWGKKDWNTDEIRKSGKAYDARWLLAQMKITRVLELEDLLAAKTRGQCAGCAEKAFAGKRIDMDDEEEEEEEDNEEEVDNENGDEEDEDEEPKRRGDKK